MLKFAAEKVSWREDLPNAKDDKEKLLPKTEGNVIDSDINDELSNSDAESHESNEMITESSEANDLQDESLPSTATNSFENTRDKLVLEPLSGEHLKAAKRLAGYFRLQWTEQGGGKCRSLTLTPKQGPQAPAETTAAEALISKYSKIENGATTKRLPTASCTPQFSGSQVWPVLLRHALWYCECGFAHLRDGRRTSAGGRQRQRDLGRACSPPWAPSSPNSPQPTPSAPGAQEDRSSKRRACPLAGRA